DGFIGLQVHSIDDGALAGRTVRWRNVRILTDGLEAERTPRDPEVAEISFLVNQLTDYEIRRGWRLLWDGATTAGWRGAKLDQFPSSGWTIGDGVLSVTRTDGGEATGPGDIVTVRSFSDFELEFEFRITAGANSGVKYFVDPELNRGPGSAIGCEFQILDDALHPDAKMGVNGNRTLGSLYDLIAAENLSTKGAAKPFKGVGRWNQGRIVAIDGHVEHWLNNVKVVEYDRDSQMFRALVASSKYSVWPGFGQWAQGRILLQDHGDAVSFRSIKIRER
ncbi:MAG: 3-keto-disaccharide hydrolase, partial [Woeseiaceae bacterium]